MTIPTERLRGLSRGGRVASPHEIVALATELLAARDALEALTRDRDEFMQSLGSWRLALALSDFEPDAEAIERIQAALAATEGEQPDFMRKQQPRGALTPAEINECFGKKATEGEQGGGR
jgi:hypothetical protein